eukprot:SAG11_NODE_36089_length_263_cov_0.939024_1_plen_58_part_01
MQPPASFSLLHGLAQLHAGGRPRALTLLRSVRPAHLAQMSMSTIIMPCNTSGYFDAAF